MSSHVSPRSVIGMIALLPILAGCGSSDSPTGSDPGNGNGNGGNGTGNGGPVATTSVAALDNLTFNPDDITVSPGAAVTWTWQGGLDHNVTWVSTTAGLANSPDQATGTHEVTMPSAAGQFAYYCTFHGTPTSGMRGTVRVE